MKIGYRLQQLAQMITDGYDHIWDCCCDHGLLGMLLLRRNAARHIHFVDIVPQLMTDLEVKLHKFFPLCLGRTRWHVHCADVAKLDLLEESLRDQKHLVIIAGVGGDRVVELVNAIIHQHASQNIEFLLCPVHHNYKLRKALHAHEFGLINEKLIHENKRGYEIIHVGRTSSQPISFVGSTMWDFTRQAERDYLHKTIMHFKRKNQGTSSEYTEILAAYQRLQSSMDSND